METIITKKPQTLKEISKAISKQQRPDVFIKETEDWIGDNEIIWSLNDMVNNQRILIITKNEDGYSLVRCFPLGPEKWAVSLDISEKEETAIFSRLIALFSSYHKQ
jgi:hypothetical protein